MIITLLLGSLGILSIGGIACAAVGGSAKRANFFGALVAVAGAVPAIWLALVVLVKGDAVSLRLPWQVPWGELSLAVDALSAFFILIIAAVCALAAVYGAAYLKHWQGRKHLGAAWLFYNLLFASMLVVVASRNGLLFLMGWEIMALSSFFLVMFEHEKKAVREAGWTYLTASHLGAAFLLVLFVLLGGPDGASLDFDRLAPATPGPAAGVLFLLALAGFGAKAGFLPLHVWLPEAHPAAPSHVSAVMSAVMIKTGIYGLIRILALIGPPPLWWGWTLLGVGAASGILGILLALGQHDLKRLLAYSSVENVGIICLGLGLWQLGTAANHPMAGALGLIGALLHVWNHAVFKGLLFLGAGAVAHAAGTREIDRLGGLIKKMPYTGLAFGIAAAAVCGLPPLNAFVGEFLLLLGSFETIARAADPGSLAAGGLTVLAALGLIGGLSAVCFAKAFGVAFLGEPRSEQAALAHEAPLPMCIVMLSLAFVCLAMGLAGPFVIRLVMPAAALSGASLPVAAAGALAQRLLWRVTLVVVLLAAVIAILWLLRAGMLARRTVTTGPTWDCGYLAPTPRMQYTASSFASPVLDMFRWLVRPRVKIDSDTELFPHGPRLSSRVVDVCRQGLFEPLFRTIKTLAQLAHRFQQGRNQLYILYIALTMLALLFLQLR